VLAWHAAAVVRSLTAAETRLARSLLPEQRAASVVWNQSVMELGALICTARSPRCGQCPVLVPRQPALRDRLIRGAQHRHDRAAHLPVGALPGLSPRGLLRLRATGCDPGAETGLGCRAGP
jgi:hypothetical protein